MQREGRKEAKTDILTCMASPQVKTKNKCIPGVDPLLDFGAAPAAVTAATPAFPDSQLSDLVDFGSGAAGGMTATLQASNGDPMQDLEVQQDCILMIDVVNFQTNTGWPISSGTNVC